MIAIGMALLLIICAAVGAVIGARLGRDLIASAAAGFAVGLLADVAAVAYTVWVWNRS